MLFKRFGLIAVSLVALATAALADPSQIIAGRCHMDACSWFRILETEIVKSNDSGTLIRAKQIAGESSHPGGHYEQKTPIKWGEPKNHYVFCSKVRAAVMFFMAPGDFPTCRYGCWLAHLLSPGYSAGVFGYNMTDYEDYFRICHGLANVDPNDVSLANKFGYPPSLVDQVGQVELKSPEDIFNH
jgi:hypothetical protein